MLLQRKLTNFQNRFAVIRKSLKSVPPLSKRENRFRSSVSSVVTSLVRAGRNIKKSQTICGIQLPSGLRESEELPEPLFTPSTKATEGHDENINFEQVVELIGAKVAEEVRYRSLQLYKSAAKYARSKGVIIADTKFEFGLFGDELVLIDEVLTPDSSRFWGVTDYEPGRPQHAFDKQFVRDYLNCLDWDKRPPAPNLPNEIVENTVKRYVEAYQMITGKEWSSD